MTASESADPADMLTDRLFGLCRLWSAIRWFHPWVVSRHLDLDGPLVKVIKEALGSLNEEDYRQAVASFLGGLDDPATKLVEERATGADGPLESALEPCPPRVERTEHDRVVVVVARDYRALANQSVVRGILAQITATFRDAEGLVLDLRREDSSVALDLPAWGAASFTEEIIKNMIEGEVRTGSYRHRVHRGMQPEGSTAGIFSSGFLVQDPGVLLGTAGQGEGKRVVVLADRKSSLPAEELAGIQARGLGALVFEGDGQPSEAAGPYVVALPHGMKAAVRTSELICPDGVLGLVPDLVVSRVGDLQGTPALQEAVRLAAPDTRLPPRPIPGPPQMGGESQPRPHPDGNLPDVEHRILALFRLWDAVDRFFPYKALMDRPWDEAFRDFLPRMIDARDADDFVRALLEMVARLQDTHGTVLGPLVDKFLGTHYPPVVVRQVGGRTVVVAPSPASGGERTPLIPGDVLVEIDGEPVDSRRRRLAPLLAASTPQALDWRTDLLLLLGEENSMVRISADRAGSKVEVELVRTVPKRDDRLRPMPPATPRSGPVWTVLDGKVGYIDLDRLTLDQVDEAMEAVFATKHLIIDIRGYPKGTAFEIAPRLAETRSVGARFSMPVLTGANPAATLSENFVQEFEGVGGRRYGGEVLVLIDESSISHAEHSCLLLEAATRVTYIGTPTSGANGNVTKVQLPAELEVWFTGLETRHGDGRQLQRVGIRPHIRVEPSVDGIREGRDEVLEAAISHVRSKRVS